ncbi:hypothetical protein ACH5RR_015588 [Cinchona calisaya]|uniref:Uncharacterized protein n=1 Tax=Cinchona calisaya TaxID=153742 RepID=A0ABD2ZUF6_9GENT
MQNTRKHIAEIFQIGAQVLYLFFIKNLQFVYFSSCHLKSNLGKTKMHLSLEYRVKNILVKGPVVLTVRLAHTLHRMFLESEATSSNSQTCYFKTLYKKVENQLYCYP